MIHAWYEKTRDERDSLYFAYHEGKNFGRTSNPFPSFHNSVELAVGLKGSLPIVIGGRKYTLGAGEICFMNSREPHRYYYNGGVECYIVVISSSFFTDANRLGELSFPAHMERCEGFDAVRAYLELALAEWDGESFLCKRALADSLAYLMARHYPTAPRQEPERQSAVLLDAVKYICEHCTERLTVGEVAASFGYSANYFSTVFNEFMGASFNDYLNACRMIEFHKLHRSRPELSVSRAAEMCGFGSMNTFYRARERLERERAENRELF